MTDTLEQKLDRIQELNRELESASVERDILVKEVGEYMKAIGYKLVPDVPEESISPSRFAGSPLLKFPGVAYTGGTITGYGTALYAKPLSPERA